jgi:protein-S-isoprenylcysteine O-methyltransferase Ste14
MLSKLGNQLFHYRNFLFPVFYLALFIPSEPIFRNIVAAEITGLILILAGIAVRCITIGLVYIVRGGKNREIYADDLVTGGIYGICRNPMYTGNILLILGFGIFANSLLFTLVFCPLFIFIYIAIIKAEETFLISKFGQRYADYRKNVNALIPDLRKISNAFDGNKFSWKKILNKEHFSLHVYLCGILIILFCREQLELVPFVLLFGIANKLAIVIKWMKIRHFLDD